MSKLDSEGRAVTPERASADVNERQLRMTREEGNAYQRSLRYMAEDVADAGGQQRAGDFIVGWTQEGAEGMWHLDGERLMWHDPARGENCHVDIAVADAADGRFIPYLDIGATLIDADGKETGPFNMPFAWHPGLFHYGSNMKVPGAGTYTLRVSIATPTFMRHDYTNGQRYAQPVTVEFSDVRITPGRK